MKKNLTPLGLLWISFTSMIGSGWLFGALYSAHLAGPAAIFAWPIAGVLLLIVALSYAEIATMFPQSDSLTLLPFYTHGHLTSVIMSFLCWISLAIIPVIETQGLVQYASNYIPGLMQQHGIRYVCTPLGYFAALILMASFVVLNYFGIRFFARVNAVFTIWKLIIPTITIIALMMIPSHVNDVSAYGGFMPYGWQGVMAAMSSGGVLFSLLGFRQVIFLVNQIENPGKYVPMVLISSLLLTTLLYTALQWTFIWNMRPQDLVHGWNHLSFPGDAGPFAALAVLAGLVGLSSLLYVDAFVSPYSTALVYSTTAAQMLSGVGAMQDAPNIFALLNRYQAPYISLLINFVFGMLIFFLLRSWQEMAAFSVAVVLITYAIGPICLVCLRKQLPQQPRPFCLRFPYFFGFLGFYICTAGVYWAGLHSVFRLLVLMMLGMLLYFLYDRLVTKVRARLDGYHALWMLVYFLSLGIFSYAGNYGGKHWLPAYWDLLYLAGVCLIIFVLAYCSRKVFKF